MDAFFFFNRSGPCVHFVQLFVTQSNLPQPPKRPVTAYLDFVKKSWPQLAQDDPNMAANAKIKTIAAKWRDLDPREKEVRLCLKNNFYYSNGSFSLTETQVVNGFRITLLIV